MANAWGKRERTPASNIQMPLIHSYSYFSFLDFFDFFSAIPAVSLLSLFFSLSLYKVNRHAIGAAPRLFLLVIRSFSSDQSLLLSPRFFSFFFLASHSFTAIALTHNLSLVSFLFLYHTQFSTWPVRGFALAPKRIY